MKVLSIRTKFLTSFAFMLVLICALGMFALWQLSVLTNLNRYSNADLLPEVAAGGRIDGEISDIRVAESEYLMTDQPRLKENAEHNLAVAKTEIDADLHWLRTSEASGEERATIASLGTNMPLFFQANDEYMALSRSDRAGEARALFMGDLLTRFARINVLVDRYIAINRCRNRTPTV